MYPNWRLKLREADQALKEGRLDEAGRLLSEGDLVEFLPGRRLAARLVQALILRARQSVEMGELDTGWSEWNAAFAFTGETQDLASLRSFLIGAGLRDAEEHLRRGDTTGALKRLDQLEKHKVTDGAVQTLREVARRMESANHLGRRGRFADAEAQMVSALTLRSDLKELKQRRDAFQEKVKASRRLTERLHRATGESRWSDAVAIADELLELAPECRLARDARRKAWAAVGANLADSGRVGVTQAWAPSHRANRGRFDEMAAEASCGSRFLLWVDGVGGYLVCLSDQVVLGQATTGNRVDVPILADISRRHAKIRREGESYVIEPMHATRVNGRSVQSKTILGDGDEIELGGGVRFRFRQPHALSGSARLEFASRHRTQPYADSVLLMAESCVLGPRGQNHVVCRDWTGDIVLYRHDDRLYCRAMESIEIDGRLCDGRGRLDGNSHVVGSDFSLSLEELDRCSSQPLL
ncbi:MAG: FHA domain-containing protein [Pirellulaceae bacterium]